MSCCLNTSYQSLSLIELSNSNGKNIYRLDYYNKTYIESISGMLSKIKITEKISEIVDLGTHLFYPILTNYLNMKTLNVVDKIHSGAHQLEHLLHSFCFLNDLVAIANKEYLVYSHGQIDLLQTTGKVIHSVSHCFSSVHYLYDLEIIKSSIITKIARYHLYLSAVGFALVSVGLILNIGHTHKVPGQPDNSKSNLMFNISGFVNDLLQSTPTFKGSRNLSDLVGLLHAIIALYPKPVLVNVQEIKTIAKRFEETIS